MLVDCNNSERVLITGVTIPREIDLTYAANDPPAHSALHGIYSAHWRVIQRTRSYKIHGRVCHGRPPWESEDFSNLVFRVGVGCKPVLLTCSSR